MTHYSRYWRLMRMHRPIGTWLLLWPTLWAIWIASAGRPDPKVFLILVLGTIVVRSAGCVINDFVDRKIDPRVARTADRPLATGEVAPVEALILFGALMVIALGLVLNLNKLTLTFALAGAFLTIVYPFTKRFLSTPQFVLGVAFSWGVPMAFAATAGDVPRVGWLLFLATVIWVVAYDTQYAMTDRPDDIKIGVRSTAILFGDLDRAFVAGLQALFLASLVLVGRSADMGAWYYGGIAAAGVFCLYQAYLIKERDIVQSFRAFLNNAWLGGAVFAGIVLDYTFRS
ncbi:MAG TPA: 4-hydroxybenzoate octaprenyltransferase [Gammaproteobacteria bacterium]|nr:4-hydroxybenzoate octaprenyltransferase [Gammaproteobacteria bacterium]